MLEAAITKWLITEPYILCEVLPAMCNRNTDYLLELSHPSVQDLYSWFLWHIQSA